MDAVGSFEKVKTIASKHAILNARIFCLTSSEMEEVHRNSFDKMS